MKVKKTIVVLLLLSILVASFSMVPVVSSKPYTPKANKVLNPKSDTIGFQASGSPWDYIVRAEFNLTYVETTLDLFELSWYIRVYLIEPSGVGDWLSALQEIGIVTPVDLYIYDQFIPVVVELQIPFTNITEFLFWLHQHSFISTEGIEEYLPQLEEAASSVIDADGFVRSFSTLKYSNESPYLTGDYYAFNPIINGIEEQPEEFKLDLSIVVDIIENVVDAIQKGLGEKELMGKIQGAVVGKIMDMIKKKLLEKIVKELVKKIIKTIFWVLEIKPAVLGVVEILKKLGAPIPDWMMKIVKWLKGIWFIDPPEQKLDLHLFNQTGGHLLGVDYATNTTLTEFAHGLYFGPSPSMEVIIASTKGFPYNLTLVSRDASAVMPYNLYTEDIGANETQLTTGAIFPLQAASGRVYQVDNVTRVNQIIASSTFSTLTPTRGETVLVDIDVFDENATRVSDASVILCVENLSFPVYNLGNGTYRCSIDTSNLEPREYQVGILATRNVTFQYFGDSDLYTLTVRSPVGGIWVPVDKFGLLAPYIALASTILVATAATTIYVKRVKRRKKKQ